MMFPGHGHLFLQASCARVWRCSTRAVTPHNRGMAEFRSTVETCPHLQEENKQLRATLQSLKWPPLTSFQVRGHVYNLPYVADAKHTPFCTSLSWSLPLTNRLKYLAGFFDGDGCVHPQLSGCHLSVGQSFDAAEVLMLFQATFGGCISHLHGGAGLCKPCLQWKVSGSAARRAVQLLLPFSIVKHKQLELAWNWPKTKNDREEASRQLSCLKQYDSGTEGPCSWEYLAGFFDAEGHVGCRGKASLQLTVCQKHVTVLECLCRFLACEIPHNFRICRHGSKHWLFISKTSICKQVLQKFLGSGMLRKSEIATLALDLTPENATIVRASMSELVGNQHFGKTLDEAGLSRAQHIREMQRQASLAGRNGQVQKAEELLVEIGRLKREHVWLKAQLENCRLHQYTRALLSLQEEACVPAILPTNMKKCSPAHTYEHAKELSRHGHGIPDLRVSRQWTLRRICISAISSLYVPYQCATQLPARLGSGDRSSMTKIEKCRRGNQFQ